MSPLGFSEFGVLHSSRLTINAKGPPNYLLVDFLGLASHWKLFRALWVKHNFPPCHKHRFDSNIIHSKFYRLNFHFNFLCSHHSKPANGHPSKSHLSKSCTALHSYEDGVEITSSEDNTIRIQIKYDEFVPTYSYPKLPTNVRCDNTGISRRVTTNFSDNFRFNEKPIDVPEDFERNARLRVREQSKGRGRKKFATSIRHLNPLEEFLQVSFWQSR